MSNAQVFPGVRDREGFAALSLALRFPPWSFWGRSREVRWNLTPILRFLECKIRVRLARSASGAGWEDQSYTFSIWHFQGAQAKSR